MTNQQLYLSIGLPMLFNAGLIGILLAYINTRFTSVDRRFDTMERAIEKRLDDLRDL
jgi:hypothetical protein